MAYENVSIYVLFDTLVGRRNEWHGCPLQEMYFDSQETCIHIYLSNLQPT
jgi:hypothetical protein